QVAKAPLPVFYPPGSANLEAIRKARHGVGLVDTIGTTIPHQRAGSRLGISCTEPHANGVQLLRCAIAPAIAGAGARAFDPNAELAIAVQQSPVAAGGGERHRAFDPADPRSAAKWQNQVRPARPETATECRRFFYD